MAILYMQEVHCMWVGIDCPFNHQVATQHALWPSSPFAHQGQEMAHQICIKTQINISIFEIHMISES